MRKRKTARKEEHIGRATTTNEVKWMASRAYNTSQSRERKNAQRLKKKKVSKTEKGKLTTPKRQQGEPDNKEKSSESEGRKPHLNKKKKKGFQVTRGGRGLLGLFLRAN